MAGFRPEHAPTGDPCAKCAAPAKWHRSRVAARRDKRRVYDAARPKRRVIDRIIGVDGEGFGRRPHLYTYLAAADEQGGEHWRTSVPFSAHFDGSFGYARGLSTVECLDMLLGLPERALVVGFAFFYDLTKILQDMTLTADGRQTLHYLLHEQLRAVLRGSRIVYRAVTWQGYRLNFMNKRFTVSRGKRHRTVWDIFAFFQSKFTKALRDWKTVESETIDYIERMKDQRADFTRVNPEEVRAYCDTECVNLAQLCRQLINAHDDAEIPLKHYFGAGSTASALLNKLGVRDKRGEQPEEMRDAVARSFFGGRFENSFSGPVNEPVVNNDISSAYAYHLTFLPCLAHGNWFKCDNPTDDDIANASLALVHWSIPIEALDPFIMKTIPAFGPFPVRNEKGTIAFPLAGKGGWVWREEFFAGRKLQAYTQAKEAWLYHCECDCVTFNEIPTIYKDRLRVGKEGKGIALKVGLASCYGKVAQSKGLLPPFQSWVWASNITSGCRAQLLGAIFAADDSWDVLMLATDGVWSRKPLNLPAPRDTGTDVEILDESNGEMVRKPLGGWESKDISNGVMCVRPGIYFPLKPTEKQLKEVRARGVGKKELYDRWQLVLDAWRAGADKIELTGLTRFIGAKSAVRMVGDAEHRQFVVSDDYGEWIDHSVKVSFGAHPKRTEIMASGRMKPWGYFDWESVPYDPALKGPEALALILAEQQALEQPDVDMGNLDTDDTRGMQ